MTVTGNEIRKARESLHMTRPDLAEQVGAHMQTINKIERGEIKWSRFHPQILTILGLEPPASASPQKRGGGGGFMGRAAPPLENDLPIYCSTSKAPDLLIAQQPLGFRKRPAMLDDVPDAFCVLIADDAMEPAYEAGDTVICNPNLPPLAGYDALLRGVNGQLGNARLVRLTGVADGHWSVKQWNRPRGAGKLSRGDYPGHARVVAVLRRP